MDIPQGNRIDPALIERLEIGMTRNQVKFLLGSPAVLDPHRPDQWHYVYFFKSGKDQKSEARRMTLHFKDDSLFGIEGTLNPE
jgi:outer membrane protein assembly factor BamE